MLFHFNQLCTLETGNTSLSIPKCTLAEYNPPGSYIEKQLLPYMVARGKTIDVLKFLGDVTKTNATYIDEQLLWAVFRECYAPTTKQPIEEVSMTLDIS